MGGFYGSYENAVDIGYMHNRRIHSFDDLGTNENFWNPIRRRASKRIVRKQLRGGMPRGGVLNELAVYTFVCLYAWNDLG
jgi:hypothetical protein